MTEQQTKQPPTPHKQPPALHLDWEAFTPYLQESDLTDAQKREFIETLWSIVVAFVDMGFSIKDTPQICGQSVDLNAVLGAPVVSSKNPRKNRKDDAA